MNVLIIGGAGLIGQKLARRLAERGTLRGENIDTLTLADINDPLPVEADFEVRTASCNIADPASLAGVIDESIDVIFLLAAIVSAHAEEDLDAGLSINMGGTLNVLQRCRDLGSCPVLVFTSSIAVNGGDVPQPFSEVTATNPQTSYGIQKAIGELLVNDFSRRGLVDGRSFRLPTISVRPGKPNRAASGFMSSIFREPLQGQTANCPVSEDFNHFYLSPRRCVENLILGAELEASDLGQNRTLAMPGLNLTIREMIDAMTAVAGPEPASRITWEPQPELQKILAGWRMTVDASRAEALGLGSDESFEDNIRYFLEDDIAK